MTRTLRAVLAGLLAGLVLGSTPVVAPSAGAATGLEGFDPGHIITDEAFYDHTTMDRDAIAAFLNDKGSSCVPGPDGTPCLKDYRTSIPDMAETAYCKAVAALPDASSADVIAAASTACGVNPQVLLVLLQKEQALVTGSGDRLYPDRYTKATGLGCPDFQQCDPRRATFFGQVYGAAERFRIYRAHPGNYRHQVGRANKINYHPEPLCGTANVVIRNQATAGLYNYTPYVPNARSLAAVAAEGDLCSAYGNRNFYRYLRVWFPGSAHASNADPVTSSPASTVTPQMTAIYARARAVGSGVLGAATSSITCHGGTCTKEYAKASITWTQKAGAQVVGRTPRVQGGDRYATAVEVSKRAYPQGAQTVFVATGAAFADALAAGPWARAKDAPILLTAPDALPAATRAELARLKPQRVVVVGGSASISDAVLAEVGKAAGGVTAERVSGATRYETAVAISKEAFPTATQAYVASGRSYPDALVSGPLTGGTAPLLLVPGDQVVPGAVLGELGRLGVTRVTVLGGAQAVSEANASALPGAVDRIAGANRYATAAAVAERAFDASVRAAYLASGENFPDALVAIGLQGSQPGPILLARQGCVPQETLAHLKARPAASPLLIGGAAALSGNVSALVPC